MPRARHWLTKSLQKKTVDLVCVVPTDVGMKPTSPTNMMKNRAVRQEAAHKNAMRMITDESHECSSLMRSEGGGGQNVTPAGCLWRLMKIWRVMKIMENSWKFVRFHPAKLEFERPRMFPETAFCENNTRCNHQSQSE